MTDLISPIATSDPVLNSPLDGRYQIIEILAAQLWQRTYLAQDLRRPSQPECVIHHFRIIPDIPNYAATVRCLFARETAILEEVSEHPQIPQFLAYFENQDGFYIVQAAIQGHPLSAELQPGVQWTAEHVGQLLIQLLDPLALVHHYGSLHGNLKPNNLLRRKPDGQLMLIDFGAMPQIQRSLMIAYSPEAPICDLTQQSYQSLEQVQGFPCPASDVYAVGMMAIQALTGLMPAQIQPNSGDRLTWQNHCSRSQAAIQVELLPILDRMVQLEPADRYASAQEVLHALQPILRRPIYRPAIAVNPSSEQFLPVEFEHRGEEDDEFDQIIKSAAPLIQTANIAEFIDSPRKQALSPDPTIATPPRAIEHTKPYTRVPISKNGDRPIKLEQAANQQSQLLRLVLGGFTNQSVQWGMKSALLAVIVAIAGANVLNALMGLQGTDPADQDTAKKLAANPRNAAANSAQKTSTALAQPTLAKAEAEAEQKLQAAFADAGTRQFTSALQTLRQIPPGTAVQPMVQAKLIEYQGKERIRAQADLQEAYEKATQRKFNQAIPYLRQIPKSTPAYAIAQKKIIEYTQKQQIRDQSLLSNAAQQANQQNPQAALATLTQIPQDTTNAEINQKTSAYTAQLNQQANQWLQEANLQHKAGNLAEAMTYWEKVPIGTLAYAEARDRLVEFGHSTLPPANPTNPSQKSGSFPQNLNPGSYLRSIDAM
jgi:serine/threonine protein kinase